jgi:CHAD domain-containing protein
MAKAREIPGLHAELSYREAAARTVAVRAQELFDHAEGVLDTSAIERVHDMRVATRRLRAALEVFEPCFEPKRFSRVLSEVKALADVLGERRDPDVTIAALVEFAGDVGKADRPGVESLIAQLRGEQSAANEALAPVVSAARLAKLDKRLSRLVTGASDG